MGRRTSNRRKESQDSGIFRRWRRRIIQVSHILLILGVTGGVGWGCVQLFHKLNAPVAVITVESRFERVGREDIELVVAKNIDGGFLSLSLDKIRQALEAHPWIESASARRVWPDRVDIAVVEEIPIARWGQEGFLNRRGKPLDIVNASGLDSLPLLQGPEGTARQVMEQYREISQLLHPARLQIAEFSTDRRGSLELQLKSGPRLLVGKDSVMQRMRRFLEVWQLALSARAAQVAKVDIRYGNGVAVQWKSDSKIETPENRST